MVSAYVAEQIITLTSDSQKNAVVTNVTSPMVQASGTEGQSVASTSLTVTAGLDGPSTTSAVLTVCSATTTTATVPTISHASSRAVSVMTSARPCEPIVTVVSTSDYIAGHPIKKKQPINQR